MPGARSQQPGARRRRRRPGPKASITLAVVKRVSRRVGLGSTLSLALAAECHPKINEETWKKALQSHPEFSPHYEGGKGKFIELACRRLAGEEDAKYLCWLLERRHADLFHKSEPAGAVVNVSQSTSVEAIIPADVLERAREISRDEK